MPRSHRFEIGGRRQGARAAAVHPDVVDEVGPVRALELDDVSRVGFWFENAVAANALPCTL